MWVYIGKIFLMKLEKFEINVETQKIELQIFFNFILYLFFTYLIIFFWRLTLLKFIWANFFGQKFFETGIQLLFELAKRNLISPFYNDIHVSSHQKKSSLWECSLVVTMAINSATAIPQLLYNSPLQCWWKKIIQFDFFMAIFARASA